MKSMDVSVLQELDWQDIRSEVRAVNKELSAIIDKLSPSKRYKLIKATYHYGDLIIKDGVTYLPSNIGKQKLLPVTDVSTDPNIKSRLTYSSIPLTLTLKNANEVFLDTGSRAIPLNVFKPGDMLGLFESMDFIFKRPTLPKWSVSAGARSIFMLPKITETGGFKRLRLEYGLNSTLQFKGLSDHWKLFKAIASHENFHQEWKNEVLFFSKEWLSHSNDPAWFEFYQYLMRFAWYQAQFAISKIDIGINWEYFTALINSRNLKPNLYITDQIKHVMYVASGMWPGFRPVDNSQLTAPTQGLQEAIINVYQLKNYLPTLMRADMLKNDDKSPVYYSLYYPILLEGSPKNTTTSTMMLDLREIKLLLDMFKRSSVEQSKSNYDFIKRAKFDYFHVEHDKYKEISLSQQIPQADPDILNNRETYKDRIFCSTSSFWRGCIRISNEIA